MERTGRSRRRTSALVACALVAALAGGAVAEPPPPDPGTPEWPTGRVPRRSYRNELLLIPRLVLSLPRAAIRLLSWPIRWGVVLNSRYQIYQRVIDALTSADGLVGVRPSFDFASDYTPALGLSFFDERIVGPGTTLDARLVVGGAHMVIAHAMFRPVRAGRPVSLDFEVAYTLRDDQLFRAIPSVSPDRGNARFAIDAADLWLRPTFRLASGVTLAVGAQLGVRRFTNGASTLGDLPITQVYCVRIADTRCIPGTVDERQVPGFNQGTQFVRPGVALGIDTFDRAARPSAGVQLDLAAHYSQDLIDSSGYFHFAGGVGLAIDVWQRSHILLVRLRSELVLPADDRPVPFSELPFLGGVDSLRGFRPGRFRDYSSLIATAEYRWPIWMWADGVLFVDYGGVAGQAYAGLDAGKLYPDVGVGIRVRTRDHVMARVQVAYGFPDGFQVYLTLGSGP